MNNYYRAHYLSMAYSTEDAREKRAHDNEIVEKWRQEAGPDKQIKRDDE